MKLRVVGGAMDLTVRKLKGVGVKMASPEALEAITRGTLPNQTGSNPSALTSGSMMGRSGSGWRSDP